MAGYKQTEAGAIPEEWEAIQLGQVAAFVTSGSPQTIGELIDAEGFPLSDHDAIALDFQLDVK